MFRFIYFWDWSKWKHVEFVDNHIDHCTYEILKRENYKTGVTQYKRILVSPHIMNLGQTLTDNHAERI